MNTHDGREFADPMLAAWSRFQTTNNFDDISNYVTMPGRKNAGLWASFAAGFAAGHDNFKEQTQADRSCDMPVAIVLAALFGASIPTLYFALFL